MRKVLSVLALLALAGAIWLGARAFVHRGEIRATVVFDDGRGITRGAPVTVDGAVAGHVLRVEPVDSRTAVTIRLDRDHRRAVVSDSLFAIDHGALVVTNTFAVGPPVENGAMLHAREDRISRWLARHGSAVGGVVQRVRAGADELIDRDFEQWSGRIPEWKREGSQAFARHLGDARQQVDKAAADLEQHHQGEEARRLKERFETWVREATR